MAQVSAESSADQTATGDSPVRHRVIVAGYGPVGRVVVDLLEKADAEVTVLDTNVRTAEGPASRGRVIVHGDVTDPADLLRAGIEHAEALILAIPNEDDAVRACEVARGLNANIFIAARTNFLSRGLLATRAGADRVVVEEVVTAEAMKQAVIEGWLDERIKRRTAK